MQVLSTVTGISDHALPATRRLCAYALPKNNSISLPAKGGSASAAAVAAALLPGPEVRHWGIGRVSGIVGVAGQAPAPHHAVHHACCHERAPHHQGAAAGRVEISTARVRLHVEVRREQRRLLLC